MDKATLKLLEELHGELAKTLLKTLREQARSEEGPQASFLSAVIKFLKDNHIEATLGDGDYSMLEKQLGMLQDLPYDGEVPDEYKQ